MATYKKITTVSEISQLSSGATVFVNDAGALRQAKLALIVGGATGATLSGDNKSTVVENGIVKLAGFDGAASNTYLRKAANGTVEWAVVSGGSNIVDSDEIMVADNGSLEIGEIDIVKIIQDSGTELVFDAGTSV